MTRSRRSQWRRALVLLFAGALLAVTLVVAGSPWWAGLVAVGCAVAAWWVSPASPLPVQPSASHWEAQQRHVREGSVIIYWRPGCMYCLRLRAALGRRVTRVSMVDIWADDEGAAFVRDVNGGAEIVPTVVLDTGDVVTNPPPAQVLAAVRG